MFLSYSEGSDLAVSVFNKENLMQYLFPCLQPDVYGCSVAVAVGMYSVVDLEGDGRCGLTRRILHFAFLSSVM